MKRVFLCVLDSFGIGYLPDAKLFGDLGANTLKSVTRSEYLEIPNLIRCGLGLIDGVDCIQGSSSPLGAYGRCAELSMGKDTTVGHFEIAGLISKKPLPTYKNGFPDSIIKEFEKRTGRGVICNKPYSGTDVIRDYGREHMESGKLIVYTSADSVFQIAAHEDIVPLETLYEYCKIAREMLVGEHGVGRVIARPFIGSEGSFTRTGGRHDFSLDPPGKTLLDALCENGLDTIAVGKIKDIFNARGVSEHYPTHSNKEGIEATLEIAKKDFHGLCFTNLVDFDMLYGHRNDIDGYARALSEFDRYLPELIGNLRDEDLLIITADHGCDPGDISTDHTREYTPLLILGKGVKCVSLGTFSSYSVIASTIADYFGIDFVSAEKSILDIIL